MYIKFMIDENKNSYITYWLLLITVLVGLMIVVGGLTRLTDSGLSITRWDIISGILPPLSLNDWEKAFSLYKEIPEYKLLNSSMALAEFKIIYWWEYAHRLLGRIIGLFYLIPLLYFTFKKMIKKNSITSLYLIFGLILLQGFIGWYMVMSGLTVRTDVSHYRLSLHLTLAFIIFMMLFWNYLKSKNTKSLIQQKKLPQYLPVFFSLAILLQITVGAFVSGLDAGQIYQSWPLMNQNYYPDDSNLRDFFTLAAFETPSIVQFVHRNLAYLIFFLFCYIAIIVYRDNNYAYLRNVILIIFIFLFFQIFLGILTILSGAQIILASLHQLGSVFLITTSLVLVFKNSKIN